jgi:hypothetical protein
MCYQVYEVEAAAEERKMRFYVTAAIIEYDLPFHPIEVYGVC